MSGLAATTAVPCACPTCGQPLPEHGTVIDFDAGIIVRDGQFAALTESEFALHTKLAEHPGRVVSRESLMVSLYGLRHDSEEPLDKIIDVLACKARKKLKPLGIAIENVWGRGYRLNYRSAGQWPRSTARSASGRASNGFL